MLMKRRICPESSRKCLVMAGKRVSISPRSSGSVVELHSIVWTPSVNRRSAVGISTVIFISALITRDGGQSVVEKRLEHGQVRLNRRAQSVFLRDRVNGLEAVARNANDGGFVRANVTLLDQFLG